MYLFHPIHRIIDVVLKIELWSSLTIPRLRKVDVDIQFSARGTFLE